VKEGDENYDPVCYKLQVKLITAAKGGDLVAIRKALSDGAGTEGVYDESYPALQQAASHGRADAVILLLDNGANVNRVADFENTPLNSAASEGRMEVIRVLLARGADVCHGGKGHTAGDIARSRGFKEVADLLKTAESQRCK
jgi:ankyrin repeat protein